VGGLPERPVRPAFSTAEELGNVKIHGTLLAPGVLPGENVVRLSLDLLQALRPWPETRTVTLHPHILFLDAAHHDGVLRGRAVPIPTGTTEMGGG
jgi:hypothetical protein